MQRLLRHPGLGCGGRATEDKAAKRVSYENALRCPACQSQERFSSPPLHSRPKRNRIIALSAAWLLLQQQEGNLKPVLLAPLLGGAESKMRAGDTSRFVFRCVVRAGDWKSLIDKHLYVRYAGHAPDHARNKAFFERWSDASGNSAEP